MKNSSMMSIYLLVIALSFVLICSSYKTIHFNNNNILKKCHHNERIIMITNNIAINSINTQSNQLIFNVDNNNNAKNIFNKLFSIIKSSTLNKLSLLAILLFNIIPYKAIAAETKKKLVKESKKAIATAIVTKRVPLWRKILEGANSMGGLKDWKVGDNRSEISALLNIASAILIFGGFFLLASLNLLRKEIKWESNYSKELKRVQEYKENMYFDAVQEIINKLADSKTKGSTKARLQNELKELDPKGIIQKYISEGGERPDISDIINQKPVKKKNSKKSSTTASETKIKSDSKTTSSNKKVDSNNDTVNSEKYLKVLDKLSDSLENEIPPQIKRKVIDFLKTRLSTISDEKKLNNALVKIEERIGDIEYWLEYYDKIN